VDDARAKELLSAERERIERLLATAQSPDAGPDDEPHLEQHIADQGSDLYDRERDEGAAEDLEVRLAAIERAEQRLAEGGFGRSIVSGDPIPDARLEVVPWAERTVAEQAAFERGTGA
jgi:DnaK suppressor protein